MTDLRAPARIALERLERATDAVFPPPLNPLTHLGALGWFCFWIVVASGIYLYIFFDTGVTGAYRSVESLTHDQWYLGGVMRSLHRYASDALVVVVFVHLLREFIKDRYRGVRWFAWFTGVPMLWLIYALGISGYWLVWDELAQFVAIRTMEWLDTLGIFGESVARNFINHDALTGRFFTLMVFVHILAPLILLFIMWIHIQRNTRPDVNPPRLLAGGTLAAMIVLSLWKPAVSHPEANLDRVVAMVNPDWFYLPVYPLLDHVSGLTLWAALGVGTMLLLVLPWLPAARRRPVAEASVNPGNCVACGICVGACPTATPYRRVGELIAGIDLPDTPVRALREQLLAVTAGLSGGERVLVVRCEHGPDMRRVNEPGTATLDVRCLAALPPSFIDFALSRGHADAVTLAGCRDGSCHYRLGMEWTRARIAGERDPRLRARVPRDRLGIAALGSSGAGRMRGLIARLRSALPGRTRATDAGSGAEGND
jgi:quinol-cytochrome oxidoreductase complex cytochrome b subunit/coenzyme F420-reducing hydrogenase delta subunit